MLVRVALDLSLEVLVHKYNDAPLYKTQLQHALNEHD